LTGNGSDAHVRVQVLTDAGALDRDKQLMVVAELTRLVYASRTETRNSPGSLPRPRVRVERFRLVPLQQARCGDDTDRPLPKS
jgi:hypothetical protein